MCSDRSESETLDGILDDSAGLLRCPRCDVEHSAKYRYCPSCGAALSSEWRRAQDYIDARVSEQMDRVFASRFKDQTVVEVQTAELVTERVLKWAKVAVTVFGVPFLIVGGFLSFLGITSYADLTATLEAVNALQDQAQAGKGQLEVLQESIGELQTKAAQAQVALQTVPALQQQQDKLTDEVEALRQRVGGLSEKYETGGRGPGTVSSGIGDAGGVSYGSYQLSSNLVARLVADEAFPWRAQFTGLKPGSPEFSAEWKALATDEPDAFFAAQHDYIKRTFYDPLVRKTKYEYGINIDDRSLTLQNVVWSLAYQHGSRTPVVALALAQLNKNGTFNPDDQDFDKRLIEAIYAERSRRNASGDLFYFSRNSKAVQTGVAARLQSELREALESLASE